jgi:hypothetical protein
MDAVVPVCGTHLNENNDNCLASMTEHEDEIAQYRLKLEETAALVARIRHEITYRRPGPGSTLVARRFE